PIDGEAGIGYVLRSGFDLPPLMFMRDEIVALVTGARMVRAWGGITMARAAEEALVKIEAILPQEERSRVSEAKIFAPPMEMTDQLRHVIDASERATETCNVLSFDYCDQNGATTTRSVHPLGLSFWGKVWTLIAWCELRDDFRMFRLDRITGLTCMDRRFKPTRERSLAECLRRIEAQCGRRP
ncbi:MAG TPA: YafY family protein, partial [Hyphomicrobiales bacterium]|nr:YafY family protein [Hyphomicrobiales bacterium]